MSVSQRKNTIFFCECNAANTFGILGLFENGFSHFQGFFSFVLYSEYCDISILYCRKSMRRNSENRDIHFRYRQFMWLFSLLMLLRFDTNPNKKLHLIDVIASEEQRRSWIAVYRDWVSVQLEAKDLIRNSNCDL